MDVKDILLWRDIKVSAIVFVSGFVLLVCLTQFSVVSVITNIALICLAPMLALRLLLTARSAVSKSEFEHPLKAYLSKDIQVPKEKVCRFPLCFKKTFSPQLLVVLYILSYIALWFSGITLSFIGFIGAFIVPKIYDMYQTEIDSCMRKIKSAVDEVLQKITAKVPATKQKEASTPDSKDNLEHNDNDKKMS
ncbi:PREDICTED: reticulon-1-A-like [Acropora digitifera]|uniref:reticulon-1-A-like n=1 Tax=Acropora digitifera TaxID=70779 RepID=UPI00077AD63F|nr:PREDICTED: reticulon-1-A-like [Acropora digitifera]